MQVKLASYAENDIKYMRFDKIRSFVLDYISLGWIDRLFELLDQIFAKLEYQESRLHVLPGDIEVYLL